MDTLDPVAFPHAVPTIHTDRLILRASTPGDRAALFTLFSDPRVALTNLDNRGSMRVLVKDGFTEEGILRDYRYWRGTCYDLCMFSLLRRECAG